MKDLKEKLKKLERRYNNIQVYARNKENLKHNLDIWTRTLAIRDLKYENPKILVTERKFKCNSRNKGNDTTRNTYSFKYLDVKGHQNGWLDAETCDRL